MLGLSVGLSLKISENQCYRLDKVNWFRAPLSVWDAQENDSRFSLARSGNLLEPHRDPCAARDRAAVQDLTQFISAGLGRTGISLVPAWQSACGACCVCCLVMNWVL